MGQRDGKKQIAGCGSSCVLFIIAHLQNSPGFFLKEKSPLLLPRKAQAKLRSTPSSPLT